MSQHVALVTGGGRGIGAEIARKLAGAGVAVTVGARSVGECEQVAKEIRASGGNALAVQLDVGDPHWIEDAVQRVRDEFGEVDWLVNNAGIAVSSPLLGNDELFERHMRINFHGARRCIEAVLPAMRAAKYGRIVNVASTAALRGYRYIAAYAASKHALLGYARSAAFDLEGSGVAIATVCPHYVDSPMTDASVKRVMEKTGKSEADARAFFAAQNPSGVLVKMDEVARTVVELLQSGANGAVVELDGKSARTIA